FLLLQQQAGERLHHHELVGQVVPQRLLVAGEQGAGLLRRALRGGGRGRPAVVKDEVHAAGFTRPANHPPPRGGGHVLSTPNKAIRSGRPARACLSRHVRKKYAIPTWGRTAAVP